MAWDLSGQRLAVALQPPHPAAGLVALYATTYTPVVTAHFIGYARPAQNQHDAIASPGAEQSHHDEAHSSSAGDDGSASAETADTARHKARSSKFGLQLAFAQRCQHNGALLSVLSQDGLRVSNIAIHI